MEKETHRERQVGQVAALYMGEGQCGRHSDSETVPGDRREELLSQRVWNSPPQAVLSPGEDGGQLAWDLVKLPWPGESLYLDVWASF